MLSPIESVLAACGPNISCTQLSQCRPFETFRIPFRTIQRCISEGVPPPDNWKRQEGRGAVNTGGSGQLTYGNLESPFFPTAQNPLQQGLNVFSGLLQFPPGPSSKNPPDCRSYKSPHLLEHDDIRGERVPVSGTLQNSCGLSVQLDHKWLGITRGSTAAAMVRRGVNEVQVFSKQGNNLVHQSNAKIPDFYCEFNESETEVIKIYIHPIRHFFEYSNQTTMLPIAVYDARFPQSDGMYGHYLKMLRKGNSFEPPEPDPEYFRSRLRGSGGGENGNGDDAKVDDDCYSFGNLFNKGVPRGSSEMLLASWQPNSTESRSLTPQMYLADDDPGQCAPYRLNFNSGQGGLIIPPGVGATTGRISGGDSFSDTTVRVGSGSMRQLPDGERQYIGVTPISPGAEFYLSTNFSAVNEQTFIDGASFIINDERMLEVPPGSTIRLRNDYNMQLMQGGTVFDSDGRIVQQLDPLSYVLFREQRDSASVIEGSVVGALLMPSDSVLPTNLNNEAVLAYDTRLDLVCEQ